MQKDIRDLSLSEKMLTSRYLSPGQTRDGLWRSIADRYGHSPGHRHRMYRYMLDSWFIPSTPVISGILSPKNLPISCYLTSVEDSLESITQTWQESVWLGTGGGGIGIDWSRVRSFYSEVNSRGKSSGIIPFIKVTDSINNAVNQGTLRRGATAVYLDVSHPEIREFLDLRKLTGDMNRRTLNIHHGVVIPDKFMYQVQAGTREWELKDPATKCVTETISARELWQAILETRFQTGEPYIMFSDTVSRGRPKSFRDLGLEVRASNLCSEIMLPTGIDYLGGRRTAVCCLGSVNLYYFDQWKFAPLFIQDCLLFLLGVLQEFLAKADPTKYAQAIYSVMRELSVGLGVFGYHSLLQSKRIPFADSYTLNKDIFEGLEAETIKANSEIYKLTNARGRDLEFLNLDKTFSTTTAIAPTVNVSVIAGNFSPSCDPIQSNLFTQKILEDTLMVENIVFKDIMGDELTDKHMLELKENRGSVQGLSWVPQELQEVFKTAVEIDQMAVTTLAGDRAGHIDQSQSVNLFFDANTTKQHLHNVHMKAWTNGVKSLYYLRNKGLQKVQSLSSELTERNCPTDGEVCEVCQ